MCLKFLLPFQAVMYHQERLLLARECKDVAAERRAYTNLGNCHVFLGQYPVAEQYYLKALALVDPARDRALEAQACYSLGNTYSLMGDHVRAVQFYQRHLSIAKELQDAVGQGRACWSLGSAYAALGQTTEAIKFAEEHLRISQDLGDASQCSYAEANLQEYAFRVSETPGKEFVLLFFLVSFASILHVEGIFFALWNIRHTKSISQ